MATLIKMDATLLNQDPNAPHGAQNKSPSMAGNGAGGHAVHILERNLYRIF
jgi:hypothetical protein